MHFIYIYTNDNNNNNKVFFMTKASDLMHSDMLKPMGI